MKLLTALIFTYLHMFGLVLVITSLVFYGRTPQVRILLVPHLDTRGCFHQEFEKVFTIISWSWAKLNAIHLCPIERLIFFYADDDASYSCEQCQMPVVALQGDSVSNFTAWPKDTDSTIFCLNTNCHPWSRDPSPTLWSISNKTYAVALMSLYRWEIVSHTESFRASLV